MARAWLNDGKPDDSGRLCLEIDPEDGSHPIRVWGRSREEILEKAAKTVEHGARTISQLRTQLQTRPPGKPPANGAALPGATAATAPPQKKLTPAEQLQATADLSNPAKAPAAVTRLIEHETGVNFAEMHNRETLERIASIQAHWSTSRPEFPKHPINYKLLNDAAALRVGYENITADVMDAVYTELSAAGLLVAAEEDELLTPTVPPEETPANRTVRQRGAASVRRSTLSNPAPAAVTTPKYSREQIAAMSSAEYRRKLETDPEFVTAVNVLYQTPANA